MKTKHTPGKLSRRIGQAGNGVACSQREQLCNQNSVAVVMLEHDGSEEGNANAQRLVHCWNSHDSLVEAIESAYAEGWANREEQKQHVNFNSYWARSKARNALALEKGEA